MKTRTRHTATKCTDCLHYGKNRAISPTPDKRRKAFRVCAYAAREYGDCPLFKEAHKLKKGK